MMAVLLISQYIFKPAPGPKPVAPSGNNTTAAQVTQKPPVQSQTPPLPSSPGQLQSPVQASTENTTEIDTSLYHVVFTNRGAAVKSWVLKKFQDNSGKPLQVVNTAATDLPLPFTIELNGNKPAFDPNTVFYQSKLTGGGTGIEYDYSDGRTSIRKTFQFTGSSYLSEVKCEVLENGTPVPNTLMWRGGFGDQKVRNAAGIQHTVRYDAGSSKLVTKTTKDAKNGPITDSGNYTFAGLEDTFFAAVALPTDSSSRSLSSAMGFPPERKTASPFLWARKISTSSGKSIRSWARLSIGVSSAFSLSRSSFG